MTSQPPNLSIRSRLGRALEMAQRHEELRADRRAELQLAQEAFQRRLEELQTSLRREAEHARGLEDWMGIGWGFVDGGYPLVI